MSTAPRKVLTASHRRNVYWQIWRQSQTNHELCLVKEAGEPYSFFRLKSTCLVMSLAVESIPWNGLFFQPLCSLLTAGCRGQDALGGTVPVNTLNSLEEGAISNVHFRDTYISICIWIYCDRLGIDYFKVCFFFETQAVLKLLCSQGCLGSLSLLPPPKCWDYRCLSPHQVYVCWGWVQEFV